jgi:cytochrome c peroxidase
MLILLLACAVPTGWTPAERATIASLSPIPAPLPSPTNRVADDPAAARLGEALFFDAGLSIDGKTACATCHVPGLHFTDGKRFPTAIGTGTRNTPSLETVAWGTWFFWDGRSDSVWAQATGPMRDAKEMGATPEHIQARLREAHATGLTEVFGGVAEDPTDAMVQAGKALEAYQRTLAPKPARFDRYAADLVAGTDSDVLTPQEKAGLRLFVGEATCVSCHHGPLFTDHSFHNLGLPSIPDGGIDPGRARGAGQVGVDALNCRSAHADRPADLAADAEPCPELRYLDASFPDWAAAFKTPSLRNVAETAPYMHDGQFGSLAAVLAFYDTLPGRPLVGHRELTLEPLALSGAEIEALEAFLRTLTSEAPAAPASP